MKVPLQLDESYAHHHAIGTKRRAPSFGEQKFSQSYLPLACSSAHSDGGVLRSRRGRSGRPPSVPALGCATGKHTSSYIDDRISSEALCGTAQNFFCREEAAATAAGPGNPLTPRSWVPVVRIVYSGDEALARRPYPASHQSDRLVAKDASVSI
jgi:hypothetical protein